MRMTPPNFSEVELNTVRHFSGLLDGVVSKIRVIYPEYSKVQILTYVKNVCSNQPTWSLSVALDHTLKLARKGELRIG